MASVDDIFKNIHPPSKRKLEVPHDAAQFYKSAKTAANGDAKGGSHATVEDEADQDDMEAGPAPPPDGDEDYGPDDDDEGRFFGGGVEQDTTAAIDFVDSKEDQDTFVDEKYDAAWVRKQALSFEKKISKNAELRAKYDSEPTKFMESEADLDDAIKDLSILSEHVHLYDEFASLGSVGSLVSLLAHENADIAIGAIEILGELIDIDVDDPDQLSALVSAALDADILDLLVQNLQRLDEDDENDRKGIYSALSILGSLASMPSVSKRIAKHLAVLKWLFARVQVSEKSTTQNKAYAAEIISILVQASPDARKSLIDLNAVDMFLQLLAPYRHIDPPKDSDDEEFVGNLFDSLSCLVDDGVGKSSFVEAEGIELMLLMLRDGKDIRASAMRVMDHAAGGTEGTEVCKRIVEAQGLKTLFKVFMKPHDEAMMENILGILSSLLRNLPRESEERMRAVGKFMEHGFKKTQKLVAMRQNLMSQVRDEERDMDMETTSMSADERTEWEAERLVRRLGAGLFGVQLIDVILAWLMVEDKASRRTVEGLLKEKNASWEDVLESLQEQMDGMEDEDEGAKSSKKMIAELLNLLK